MPKLSYVTVCVQYLDFLDITFKHNQPNFDELIIVTSPADKATQEWCAVRPVTCVITNAFYRGGAVFNKGLAINDGFAALLQQETKPEWVCVLDADTFVDPGCPREYLHLLDKEWFYGAERILLPTYQDYQIMLGSNDGWGAFESVKGCGFGFYQQFSWESEVIRKRHYGQWYPSYPDATNSDWMFSRMWGGHKQGTDYGDEFEGQFARLPFKVWNLGKHGENHFGRRSPVFGPPS